MRSARSTAIRRRPISLRPDFARSDRRERRSEVKRAGELMLSFNGLYQDRDADQKYDNPGLTLYRSWLQVAPKTLFGDDMGDWWKAIDADRYLTYQSSLLLRAFQGDKAGLPLGRRLFQRARPHRGDDRYDQGDDRRRSSRAFRQGHGRMEAADLLEIFRRVARDPDRPQMAGIIPSIACRRCCGSVRRWRRTMAAKAGSG